jgi:hypothetical protein
LLEAPQKIGIVGKLGAVKSVGGIGGEAGQGMMAEKVFKGLGEGMEETGGIAAGVRGSGRAGKVETGLTLDGDFPEGVGVAPEAEGKVMSAPVSALILEVLERQEKGIGPADRRRRRRDSQEDLDLWIVRKGAWRTFKGEKERVGIGAMGNRKRRTLKTRQRGQQIRRENRTGIQCESGISP